MRIFVEAGKFLRQDTYSRWAQGAEKMRLSGKIYRSTYGTVRISIQNLKIVALTYISCAEPVEWQAHKFTSFLRIFTYFSCKIFRFCQLDAHKFELLNYFQRK
jgi:hypothetical protein